MTEHHTSLITQFNQNEIMALAKAVLGHPQDEWIIDALYETN